MSDDELKQFFGDEFRNPDAVSSEELQYERALILLNATGKEINFLGLDKFEKLLNQPDMLGKMETFGFSLKEYYKQYRVRNFGLANEFEEMKVTQEKNIKYEEKIREYERKIQEYEQNITILREDANKNFQDKEFYESLVNEMKESSSWKITKPLRKVGSIMKR